MTVDPSINGVASSCNPAPPAPKLACFWSKSCPRAAHSGEEGFSAQLAETTVKDAKVTTARNMMLKREWAIRRELKVLWKAWELWGIFLAKFHAMQDMSNYEMPNSWYLFTRSFNLSKCHALNPSKTKNCINDKKTKKKTLCRFAIFFLKIRFSFWFSAKRPTPSCETTSKSGDLSPLSLPYWDTGPTPRWWHGLCWANLFRSNHRKNCDIKKMSLKTLYRNYIKISENKNVFDFWKHKTMDSKNFSDLIF